MRLVILKSSLHKVKCKTVCISNKTAKKSKTMVPCDYRDQIKSIN